MTVLLKIVFSIMIFCAGFWLIVAITVDNSGKRPTGGLAGLVLFPATIAGIVAVWRYKPNIEITTHLYGDTDKYLIVDTFTGFVDYYLLLQLEIDFTKAQLKEAYRTQAVKWHPDKNPGLDTTIKMQQINEAYLILRDQSSRRLYEHEYLQYQKFNEQKLKHVRPKLEYKVHDETLRTRIFKARQEAAKLAKQSLNDMVGMTMASGKAILSEAIIRLIYFVGIVGSFTLLIKACN